ncbi:peptide deformylase [Dermabacteraceae bacterium P7054]
MDLSTLTKKILDRRDAAGVLPIVQAGHPALRRRSQDWAGQLSDELLAQLVECMIVTMRDAPGVGLAAPQVGIPLRLAVMEHDDPEEPLPLLTVLNPTYRVLDGERAYAWEGCLSMDGLRSIVPRATSVAFTCLVRDADGMIREHAADMHGWPARIVQHETDHLSGVLCHDEAVPRSLVYEEYVTRMPDLESACKRLGLSGDVTRAAANGGVWVQ